jgi:hypothetical protein
MKKRTGIYGFLGIYLLVIFISFGGNLIFYQKAGSGFPLDQLWLYSISEVTFTHANTGHIFNDQSFGFHLFSPIITLVSSWVFHSILLWLCWRLFGSSRDQSYSFGRSAVTTATVLLIGLFFLSAFFLYAIPNELTDGSYIHKILAAGTLSVNSFNNAGFGNWNYFFSEDVLIKNFMLQIGVIGGTVLGSLGIFVIIDLFSPRKLRQRLADPSIDWSFIAKISVFGSAIALVFYMVIYALLGDMHLLADKNILESLSFVLMKGISARGFGYDFIHQPNNSFDTANLAFTLFGAGPFSTGGGASLLFFLFLYQFIFIKKQLSIQITISFKIIKVWLIIGIIFLTFAFIITMMGQGNTTIFDLVYLYTNHHVELVSEENRLSGFIKTITMIAGRLSFITACIIVINQNKHASGIF